jgi:cell division protein FtsB
VKRAVLGLVLVALALFALEGGTYGTRDLLALKRQVRDEKGRIAQLRREVDSLARIERALKTDPVTQERVAREVYGMIRPGEILYQVVPGDTNR